MDKNAFITLVQQKGEVALRAVRTLGRNPRQDWQAMVWTVGVCALVVTALGALLFVRVSGGEFAAVTPDNPARAETLDRSRLSATLEQFNARAAGLEVLQSTPPEIVDPSQ